MPVLSNLHTLAPPARYKKSAPLERYALARSLLKRLAAEAHGYGRDFGFQKRFPNGVYLTGQAAQGYESLKESTQEE